MKLDSFTILQKIDDKIGQLKQQLIESEEKQWNPEKTNVDQQLNFLFGSSKMNPS